MTKLIEYTARRDANIEFLSSCYALIMHSREYDSWGTALSQEFKLLQKLVDDFLKYTQDFAKKSSIAKDEFAKAVLPFAEALCSLRISYHQGVTEKIYLYCADKCLEFLIACDRVNHVFDEQGNNLLHKMLYEYAQQPERLFEARSYPDTKYSFTPQKAMQLIAKSIKHGMDFKCKNKSGFTPYMLSIIAFKEYDTQVKNLKLNVQELKNLLSVCIGWGCGIRESVFQEIFVELIKLDPDWDKFSESLFIPRSNDPVLSGKYWTKRRGDTARKYLSLIGSNPLELFTILKQRGIETVKLADIITIFMVQTSFVAGGDSYCLPYYLYREHKWPYLNDILDALYFMAHDPEICAAVFNAGVMEQFSLYDFNLITLEPKEYFKRHDNLPTQRVTFNQCINAAAESGNVVFLLKFLNMTSKFIRGLRFEMDFSILENAILSLVDRKVDISPIVEFLQPYDRWGTISSLFRPYDNWILPVDSCLQLSNRQSILLRKITQRQGLQKNDDNPVSTPQQDDRLTAAKRRRLSKT